MAIVVGAQVCYVFREYLSSGLVAAYFSTQPLSLMSNWNHWSKVKPEMDWRKGHRGYDASTQNLEVKRWLRAKLCFGAARFFTGDRR
jgi:hypothetical protein